MASRMFARSSSPVASSAECSVWSMPNSRPFSTRTDSETWSHSIATRISSTTLSTAILWASSFLADVISALSTFSWIAWRMTLSRFSQFSTANSRRIWMTSATSCVRFPSLVI
eukprot:16133_1